MTLPTPTTSRPGTYAALRVTRNPEAFQSWWPTLTGHHRHHRRHRRAAPTAHQ